TRQLFVQPLQQFPQGRLQELGALLAHVFLQSLEAPTIRRYSKDSAELLHKLGVHGRPHILSRCGGLCEVSLFRVKWLILPGQPVTPRKRYSILPGPPVSRTRQSARPAPGAPVPAPPATSPRRPPPPPAPRCGRPARPRTRDPPP